MSKFQEFLKANPDVLIRDAFFAFVQLETELTVSELDKAFNKEIKIYMNLPETAPSISLDKRLLSSIN